jgi:hypothetical protein
VRGQLVELRDLRGTSVQREPAAAVVHDSGAGILQLFPWDDDAEALGTAGQPTELGGAARIAEHPFLDAAYAIDDSTALRASSIDAQSGAIAGLGVLALRAVLLGPTSSSSRRAASP